jgi:hypothetical protein
VSSAAELQHWVADAAERLADPGVAVGFCHASVGHYAYQGVTSRRAGS